MRPDYIQVASQLDRFFFSPLLENETLELRAASIDYWLELNQWTWDQVIEEMSKPESSTN
jgi:hypothetical protein